MRAARGALVGLLPALAFLAGAPARAQAPAAADGDFPVRDSNVGYIDRALITDMLRLRLDAAYGNRRPSRAEFFYAAPQPRGPGLPLPERSVDYQDLSAYAEAALAERFSLFAEVPVRFLNPEVNANTAGLSDASAGFKSALVDDGASVLTFQLRAFAPSGAASRGLGTRHVSLEPALLAYQRLGERLTLEGELRCWVPIGGTDFAGEVVRYGVGAGYEVYRADWWWATPVVEVVGWTVLNGKGSFVTPSGQVVVEGAGGDTIVNVKVGLRVGLGERADVYAGYGRPLTGDRWYDNILRLELRWKF
jgi:hypothetical protein